MEEEEEEEEEDPPAVPVERSRSNWRCSSLAFRATSEPEAGRCCLEAGRCLIVVAIFNGLNSKFYNLFYSQATVPQLCCGGLALILCQFLHTIILVEIAMFQGH